jgi:hypothetical protein
LDRLLGRVPTVLIAVALAALAALAFGATAVSLVGGADEFQSQVASVVRQIQAFDQHPERDPSGGLDLVIVDGPFSDCCSGFNFGAGLTIWGALFAGIPLALAGFVLALRFRQGELPSADARWRLVVLAAASLQAGSVGAALLLTLMVVSDGGVRFLTRPEGLVFTMLSLAYMGFNALALPAWMMVAGHVLPAESITLKSS